MSNVTIQVTVDDASLSDSSIYRPRILRLLHDVIQREYPDAHIRVTAGAAKGKDDIQVSDESLSERIRTLKEQALSGPQANWREPPLRLGIAENSTWIATALFDGTHIDCPAVLGGDPALSDQAYAEIEKQLAAGKTSGTVRMGSFEWEYDLVEEG